MQPNPFVFRQLTRAPITPSGRAAGTAFRKKRKHALFQLANIVDFFTFSKNSNEFWLVLIPL